MLGGPPQGELMLVLASLSGKSTHDPPHGVVGRPVILMFLSPGACLRHCYLFCRLSRHHRCGVTVLGLLPSRSGIHFFHCCLFCRRFE